MLRFNQVGYHGLEQILINFNTSYVTVQPPRLAASAGAFLLFQYILCYGSTYLGNGYREYYFGFQYILCYGSTGTRFIRTRRYTEFQYILCYGSTTIKNIIFTYPLHFNTSYVTVQRDSLLVFTSTTYFNTSYVTVQPVKPRMGINSFGSFNTSYVTVQHFFTSLQTIINSVSIHPMLRFNMEENESLEQILMGFNTSYVTVQHLFHALFDAFFDVSIHPMLRFNIITYFSYVVIPKFQYILCYGSTGTSSQIWSS